MFRDYSLLGEVFTCECDCHHCKGEDHFYCKLPLNGCTWWEPRRCKAHGHVGDERECERCLATVEVRSESVPARSLVVASSPEAPPVEAGVTKKATPSYVRNISGWFCQYCPLQFHLGIFQPKETEVHCPLCGVTCEPNIDVPAWRLALGVEPEHATNWLQTDDDREKYAKAKLGQEMDEGTAPDDPPWSCEAGVTDGCCGPTCATCHMCIGCQSHDVGCDVERFQ